MCKLGTFTTISCPTERIDEAYDFLSDKFEPIGGVVRKVSNDHDFGPYPSFEIDYPTDMEDIDDDPYLEEGEELDDEVIALIEEKNKWIENANKIDAEYNEKFGDYL